MNDVAAGAHNISKRFGATTALDNVDLELRAGEIHALVGENGAGKSTLVRILGGAVRPDEGRVTIGGRKCRLASPHDAIVNGVITIPQELHLVPALSIAENLVLDDPPLRLVFGRVALVDRARMREEARTQTRRLRFRARPRLAGTGARLRRAADRRHRQGAAATLPRAYSRRADRRAGKSRDYPAVRRAAPPEGARHRHRLCIAPARRDRDAGRPMHRAARRPRGCGGAPRGVQLRRSRGGDDRPRRRATGHVGNNARRGVA